MPDDKIVSKKKTIQIVLIAALGLIVLVLIGVLIWRGRQVNQAKNLVNTVTPTASPTTTVTGTKIVIQGAQSAVATTTPQTDEEVIFSQVKTAATNFMNAYVGRSLEDAKPYMTNEYYNSTNQSDFAGVSSPSRDRFEFVTQVFAGADVYQIDVKVYYKLQGEDSSSESFRLNILPFGDQHLVNSMSSI